VQGNRCTEERDADGNELCAGADVLYGFRYLQDFNGRDFFWLLIGVLLAVVTMVVISRRRRRWF